MTTREARRAKGKRGVWSAESMQAALVAVKGGTFGLNRAAKNYNVPKATLKRHLDKVNKYAKDGEKHLGRPSDLPEDIEQQLTEHIMHMEARFYGLNVTDLRKLAYEIAEVNGIETRFNKEQKLAGREWMRGFLARHKEITLRTPEPTSLARASGFNRTRVNKFFELLGRLMTENALTADKVYNMDESGFNVVQKVSGKILAQKGKRQVGTITSQERGKNVTAICAMNAVGNYIPPCLIFPRKRMKDELMDGAPPETMFTCQDKGWIDSGIFCEWLEHFIKHAKATKENKVLLILDGHKSHTHNLRALSRAREAGVIMLSLPPHTSHRMQPLDLTFFKPLKLYYYQSIDQWMRANPGRAVTMFQISRLFGLAYGKAANVNNAVSGFRKSGIFPVNPLVFDDSEFRPAAVTDRPAPTPEGTPPPDDQVPGTPARPVPRPTPPPDDQVPGTPARPVPRPTPPPDDQVPGTPARPVPRPTPPDDQVPGTPARPVPRPTPPDDQVPGTPARPVPRPTPPPDDQVPGTPARPVPRPTRDLPPPDEQESCTPVAPVLEDVSVHTTDNLGSENLAPSPDCDLALASAIPSTGHTSQTRKFTVKDIHPLPKRSQFPVKKRKTLGATVLTESPHKRGLEENVKSNTKSKVKRPKTKENQAPPPPKSKIIPRKKRSLEGLPSTSKAPQCTSTMVCHCVICGECYDEDWIQCDRCKNWVHEACADISDPVHFYCDNCQQLSQ